MAEEGDWLLVFDSDHMWEEAYPESSLKSCISAELTYRGSVGKEQPRVAEVAFADATLDQANPHWYEATLLYRADPGMRYVGAHWRIVFSDGAVSTTLRTSQEKHTARTLDLREAFRVFHTVFSPELAERRRRQTTYYQGRDAGEGVER
jgi:hypothetical protein